LFERWLLGRLYQPLWYDLSLGHNERRRRAFTYFHIGVTTMLVLLISGAYPVFEFLVGRAQVSSILLHNVTYGDYMFILSQIYSSYYLFEVCFRTRFASAISIAHHIGLLIVIQTALGLFMDLRKNPEAVLEFYMCMVWGMYMCTPFLFTDSHGRSLVIHQKNFLHPLVWGHEADTCAEIGSFDVVVELPLYTFMIIWRLKTKDNLMLSRMAYACCAWILLGATVETAITIWLLSRSWHLWGLSFRVLLPLVFSLWIVTQLYGAYRVFGMAQAKAQLVNTRKEFIDHHSQDNDPGKNHWISHRILVYDRSEEPQLQG
jgi:hypothetical protein